MASKINKEDLIKIYKDIDINYNPKIKINKEENCIMIDSWKSECSPHFKFPYEEIKSIIKKINKKESLEKFDEIKFGNKVHKKRAFQKIFWNKKLESVYRAKCIELYVESQKHSKLLKYLTWKYCFSRNGVNIKKFKICKKNIDLFKQLLDDNQEVIIPLIIEYCFYSSRESHIIYDFIKTNLWRRTLNQPCSRNKLIGICLGMYRGSLGDFNKADMKSLLDKLTLSKTKVLKYISKGLRIFYKRTSIGLIGFLNKNYYNKDLHKLTILFIDTERACTGNLSSFNPNWSLKRMKKEHDRQTKIHNDKIAIERERRRREREAFNKKKKDIFSRKIEGIDKYIEFFKEQSLPENVNYEVLKTGQEIEDEGIRMQHCLSIYAKDAIEGKYIVMRVIARKKEEAHLMIFNDSNQLHFIECKGKRNSEPSESINNFTKDLVRSLKNWKKG